MQEHIFQECLIEWTNNTTGNKHFWEKLVDKFNYKTVESLRSEFKRERQKRGIEKEEIRSERKAPIIVFWDIENTGMLVENVFDLYEPKLSYPQVKRDAFILSWSAKYLYDDKMYSDVLTPNEVKKGNDFRIVNSLQRMLDSADIIVAHNGNKHDLPKSNTRMLYWGINPPSYDRVLDTYVIAKNTFSFPSNSLDNITKYLGLEGKIHNEYGLWDKCVSDPDKESLNKLRLYNEQDVRCLESAYVKMLPWIKNHPNWGLYGESDGMACPQCGHNKLNWRDDKLNKGVYKVANCGKCGAPVRNRINEMSKEKRKSLLSRV